MREIMNFTNLEILSPKYYDKNKLCYEIKKDNYFFFYNLKAEITPDN
jgi:hypothetical protein